MTVLEYNKKYKIIKEGRYTYSIYINTIGYPKGFIINAKSEIDLSNKWIKYCLNNGFCTNRNIKKIDVLEG